MWFDLCWNWCLLVEIGFIIWVHACLASVQLNEIEEIDEMPCIINNKIRYSFLALTASISRGVKKTSIRWRNGTIRISTNGNTSDTLDDLTIHKMAKAITWTNVKTCIFHVGTRRTKGSGGWYFDGMKKSPSLKSIDRKVFLNFPNTFRVDRRIYRSKNCTPLIEATPMYKNTPNNTDIGIMRSRGAAVTDKPTSKATQNPETRCSFTSVICGLSPGAWVLFVNEENRWNSKCIPCWAWLNSKMKLPWHDGDRWNMCYRANGCRTMPRHPK